MSPCLRIGTRGNCSDIVGSQTETRKSFGVSGTIIIVRKDAGVSVMFQVLAEDGRPHPDDCGCGDCECGREHLAMCDMLGQLDLDHAATSFLNNAWEVRFDLQQAGESHLRYELMVERLVILVAKLKGDKDVEQQPTAKNSS